MNNKNKIAIALSVVVVVIAAVTIGFVLKLANKKPLGENTFELSKLNNTYKPQIDAMAKESIPEANTNEAKALAIKLYEIANNNLKNDDKVAYYVHTSSTVLGVPTGGHRFFIKNGKKFFNTDYFYVSESENTNAVLKGIIKGAARESTHYAIRSYYDVDLNKGYEEKAKNLELVESKYGLEIATNWDELYYHKEIEMPVWLEESEQTFKYCDFILDMDTIKTCEISYNNEQGYYTIKLSLDCDLDKTMGDSLKYLIEGAGDPQARYTEITQTIEIWDNGRYKKHFSYNKWHAPKAYKVLEMNSANDYQTLFYYDDFSTSIENYPYSDTAAEKIA